MQLSADVLPAQFGSARQTRDLGSVPIEAGDSAAFKEFGFVSSSAAEYRNARSKGVLTVYRLKDATGGLAAWDWLRSAEAHRCQLADHCAAWGNTILINEANYVLEFRGLSPTKTDLQSLAAALPDRHPSDLPPVLNFVPVKDVVPNSARYILGPASLGSVAPVLVEANPGFESGAEAHYTAYRVSGGTVKLVLFDYPSPEMARLHTVDFKAVPGTQVKRSGVLVAVVLPGASERQGEAVLDQVKYQAKILWNEPPPPNPVPTLYKLLVNIIIVTLILAALALTAGILYGLMRLYRRRFGTLEEDEAMTTLHLNG
jgi:multisubunit Na+/H+ antiporter MnhC subunit